jgi:glucokinase
MDLILGVEIGGTKLQLALGSPQGKLAAVYRDSVNVEKGANGILDWLLSRVPDLIKHSGEHQGRVVAIGCGFGGPINRNTGRVFKSNQISDWDDFPLRDWLEKSFLLPSWVENDSNAAAWGEYQQGAGRGTQHFFYTNIGSGVGGGFVFNGELYDGQGLGAGEFGHMIVPDPTEKSGKHLVEIEQVCSGWAIEERLRQPGYIPKTSDLFQRMHGSLSDITTGDLAVSAKAGDAFAMAEIDLVAHMVGIGLANVLCLTNVERIAIGGGVSKMGDLLIEPIRKHTARYVFANSKDRYDIQQSELGDEIVLVGAILLARQFLTG